MEFLLVVALAAIVTAVSWVRSGMKLREWIFHQVTRRYVQLWHRWSVKTRSPLPATGPVLLISNHTCSSDATFLQAACDRPLSWLASREHYESNPLFKKLLDALHCVPVRRDGQDALAARNGLRRLAEGRALCVFPEGNLSGVAAGRLRSPKAGAAWLALRSRATVVAAFITGGPQTHHLLQAWALPSGRSVRVVFGKPIDLRRFRGRVIKRKLLEEVSMCLMREIESLRRHQ